MNEKTNTVKLAEGRLMITKMLKNFVYNCDVFNETNVTDLTIKLDNDWINDYLDVDELISGVPLVNIMVNLAEEIDLEDDLKEFLKVTPSEIIHDMCQTGIEDIRDDLTLDPTHPDKFIKAFNAEIALGKVSNIQLYTMLWQLDNMNDSMSVNVLSPEVLQMLADGIHADESSVETVKMIKDVVMAFSVIEDSMSTYKEFLDGQDEVFLYPEYSTTVGSTELVEARSMITTGIATLAAKIVDHKAGLDVIKKMSLETLIKSDDESIIMRSFLFGVLVIHTEKEFREFIDIFDISTKSYPVSPISDIQGFTNVVREAFTALMEDMFPIFGKIIMAKKSFQLAIPMLNWDISKEAREVLVMLDYHFFTQEGGLESLKPKIAAICMLKALDTVTVNDLSVHHMCLWMSHLLPELSFEEAQILFSKSNLKKTAR